MAKNKSQELKAAQVRIHKAETECLAIEEEISSLQEDLERKRDKVRSLKSRMEKIKEKEIIVSEHAVLRFMERAMALDITQIENKILSNNCNAMRAMGNGKYPIGEGLKAVVRNGIVVTVF